MLNVAKEVERCCCALTDENGGYHPETLFVPAIIARQVDSCVAGVNILPGSSVRAEWGDKWQKPIRAAQGGGPGWHTSEPTAEWVTAKEIEKQQRINEILTSFKAKVE